MRLLRSIIIASGLVAVLALAACGGGSGNGSTDSGSASYEPCRGYDGLDSYRYSIAVKIDIPSLVPSPQPSPSEPLDGLSETLNALLSNFQIEGAHVAPDRTQVILRFQENEVELRAIGGQSWERLGDSWSEQERSAPEVTVLTPQIMCDEIVARLSSALEDAESTGETVNGIESDHYSLSEADVSGSLGDLLGTGEDARLPERFQVDIWLAADGGWPSSLKIEGEETDEQGNQSRITLSMEMRDVNDAGITVEAPPGFGD